ncbi:Protein of unknown function [Nocardioides terrae]|uniref:DUF3105 domain-containing protein n=1 Tax=Nocardioides terrae TaxID=574651 RepID=A0A1I1FSP4_9ACTN|nr:DUF3105 domain-containing protein [Nocardioides terrae]SFC00093.1 Protein of unknown function [Nocardioides terrae]
MSEQPTGHVPADGLPSVVSLGPTPPQPPTRRYVVAAVVTLAVMLVAAAVALPMLTDDEPRRATASEQGLGAVRTYAGLSVQHTEDRVDYPMTPPAGGPHDPVWLECGAYDVPLRDENAVHDLEHGSVWISYDPDLSGADVRRLESRLPQNGIMAPYPGLPAPVVVTVWGRQLRLAGADDTRLEQFIATFGHGETAPEPAASCAGGATDPDGGREPDGTPV